MKFKVLLAVLVLLIGIVVANFVIVFSRGNELAVAELTVGDCLSEFYQTGSQFVSPVECSRNHVQEVVGSTPDVLAAELAESVTEFPGVDELNTIATELCVSEFNTYTGLDYESAEFLVTGITPNAEAWDSGDRAIICLASNADQSPIEGSLAFST